MRPSLKEKHERLFVKLHIVDLILCAGLSLLAFAPSRISKKVMGVKTESRLWARLAGVSGLIWLFLGLVDLPSMRVIEPGERALLVFRHFCAGLTCGLVFAWTTIRFETGKTPEARLGGFNRESR